MYKYLFKRLFDFCISLVVLLLIGWFLIIIAFWLHFANKGAGALFFQERPGKDAKIFKVIKFKTMTDERNDNGELLPDEDRPVVQMATINKYSKRWKSFSSSVCFIYMVVSE